MGMDQLRAKQVDSSSSVSEQTETVAWLSLKNRLTQTPASCTALKKTAAKSKLWKWALAPDQVNVLVQLEKKKKTRKVDTENISLQPSYRNLFKGLSQVPQLFKTW